MKNIINKFFLRFFGKYVENAINEALIQSNQVRDKLRYEVELMDAERLVGHPVIVVSNNWKNLVVGFVSKNELITQAQQPIPVVLDYITDQELLCMGVVYEYTPQRLTALMKLTPYERWSLMVKYGHGTHGPEASIQETGIYPHLLTETDMFNILAEKGFFTRVESFMQEYNKE